jgi:hypothetical protein
MFNYRKEYEIITDNVLKEINIKVHRYRKNLDLNFELNKNTREKMVCEYKRLLLEEATFNEMERQIAMANEINRNRGNMK